MKDFALTKGSFEGFFNEIQNELEVNPLIVVTTQSGETGKWGMARLWRSWMGSTAKFMAANGATMPLMIGKGGRNFGKRPFNADDAHEAFTSRCLGVDANGTRLSWSKKGRDGMRPATKGERFNALRKHEVWCVERGIQIINPRDSEYNQLAEEQGY